MISLRKKPTWRVSLVKNLDSPYAAIGNYWIEFAGHRFTRLSREEWSTVFDLAWPLYNRDLKWDVDVPPGASQYNHMFNDGVLIKTVHP